MLQDAIEKQGNEKGEQTSDDEYHLSWTYLTIDIPVRENDENLNIDDIPMINDYRPWPPSLRRNRLLPRISRFIPIGLSLNMLRLIHRRRRLKKRLLVSLRRSLMKSNGLYVMLRGITLMNRIYYRMTSLRRLYKCTLFSLYSNISYFEKIHPLFPIIPKEFLSRFHAQKLVPDHLVWAIFLAASTFSDDPRLVEGLHSRSIIETRLKLSCERDSDASDLSLIQSLMLGQLFPAKRETKVALLSWTINGRAVKLALKRKLNIDPRTLDSEDVESRISIWWCVYLVDIWDAARRGRPPSIHEGDYNVPLPMISTTSTEEEVYFARLVQLTRILANVLSFAYNNCQTSASLGCSIDPQTEDSIRNLRVQLAEWYRADGFTRTSALLNHILEIAYLTVVILLHRPLLPTPLATAYSDPVLLLITKCASTIVRIAQMNENFIPGTVPWRLFLPAVGYLTAGVTLAQNATWSMHITGANALRLSALRDINILLGIFDRADIKGHYTSGMSGLLRNIFRLSGVEIESFDGLVPEIQGVAIPFPHEDPSFSISASRRRSSGERLPILSEKRPSTSATYLSVTNPAVNAPQLQAISDPNSRKRKHSLVSHLSATSSQKTGQQLPPLANVTGLDVGRRSPGLRSVHSISTYSSHSSASINRSGMYPPSQPVSTAYHPSWGGQTDRPAGWEQARQPKSPTPLPPLYDRRYSEPQSSSYAPSSVSREHAPRPNQTPYYPDPREEYYRRNSPPPHPPPQHQAHHPPYATPHHENPPPPTVAYRTSYPGPHHQPEYTNRLVPPAVDPRYRHPSPPPSSSNSPNWPAGYPYPTGHRYDTTSPRAVNSNPPAHPHPAAPHAAPLSRWPGREDYYFPPPQR